VADPRDSKPAAGGDVLRPPPATVAEHSLGLASAASVLGPLLFPSAEQIQAAVSCLMPVSG